MQLLTTDIAGIRQIIATALTDEMMLQGKSWIYSNMLILINYNFFSNNLHRDLQDGCVI